MYTEQQLSSALTPRLSYAGNLTVPTRHYNAGEWVSPIIQGGYSSRVTSAGTDITLTGLGDALFNIVLIEAD